MKRVVAVIATRAKDPIEFATRPIYKSLHRQHDMLDLFSEYSFAYRIVYDNKRGLSEIYNEFLYDPAYKNDILLFVHDDVELIDVFMVDKLINTPFAVTGLAGTKQINLACKPAWHLMSEKEEWVGEVMHSKYDDKKDFNVVWTTRFGPTRSRALLIDGLFIAVNVKELTAQNVKFDEEFKFHHYDMAFCLDCNLKKVKIGVLPISVIHHGLGDSMNTHEWVSSAVNFTKKYATQSA